MKLYLWEYAVSPHLGNILKGMSDLGYQTSYVVHSQLYETRKAEGWICPEFPGVEVVQTKGSAQIHAIIADSAPDDVHICVGLRANDYVREVSASLRGMNRRFLMFMETIDERSRMSVLKRTIYCGLFLRNRRWLEGVLAAGGTTASWVAARGLPKNRIFDFAYFLGVPAISMQTYRSDVNYRLLFVGSLIERKRVNLIITALSELPQHVLLDVVGDGPLRAMLETQAKTMAPGRVKFHGTRPMPEIAEFMAGADCLVLPSEHDGWGAVISEAMLAGTPVVCSDRCGASVVVRAAGRGQVFETQAKGACTVALQEQLAKGRPSLAERASLANWANCLTENSGANYLNRIIAHLRHGAQRPEPPWTATPSVTPTQK